MDNSIFKIISNSTQLSNKIKSDIITIFYMEELNKVFIYYKLKNNF